MVAVTYGSAPVTAASRANVQPKGKGFFARFWDALIEARMRRAYREIALYQHLLGKQLVTPVERDELPFGR